MGGEGGVDVGDRVGHGGHIGVGEGDGTSGDVVSGGRVCGVGVEVGSAHVCCVCHRDRGFHKLIA